MENIPAPADVAIPAPVPVVETVPEAILEPVVVQESEVSTGQGDATENTSEPPPAGNQEGVAVPLATP